MAVNPVSPLLICTAPIKSDGNKNLPTFKRLVGLPAQSILVLLMGRGAGPL